MEKTEKNCRHIEYITEKKALQNYTTETCPKKTPQKSMFMKTERLEYIFFIHVLFL